MNKLYLRVKELAAQKHVSLAKVERDLGFSNGIISTWKTGKASQDKINSLADYFNVSTDYLLGRPEKHKEDQEELDLEQALDNAHSFSGKPLSDHDRKVAKDVLRSLFQD